MTKSSKEVCDDNALNLTRVKPLSGHVRSDSEEKCSMNG